MAAYGALTSLNHIIHDLQNHPSPPISIDEQQVQSLTEMVTFLQEFIQGYNSNFANSEEVDPLETRIADAAFAAEDVIESEIVERLLIRSTIVGKIIGIFKFSQNLCKCTCLVDYFYQDLQLVIEEMDLIKKAAMAIRSDSTEVRPQLRKQIPVAVGSSASSSSYASSSSSMVGFDDALNEVMEHLVGSKLDLQIIPIMGMGGIGKTTLARNLFDNAYVKEEFDTRAWTTISQDYNAKEALKELLSQSKGNPSDKSENELGKDLYQYLLGRYLIVMDDMWSIEVWEKVRRYFPNYKNGSRIIITTRLSNLASHFKHGFSMKFLDEISSWNLFSKTVFGEEAFPLELKDIGKKIVKNCRGLPLSIVTTGGLLAKSEQTRTYWEYIEGNLNSIVNSEGDEYCLRILKMSYNHLPIHLKPCFLYTGVFSEDQKIRVSTLIKLWVSQGYLQPTSEKTLEEVAKENLKNLIERNIILVHELGSIGNIKYCKIHDLLRDLCLREAKKERFYKVVKSKFYRVVRQHIPEGKNSLRCVVIHEPTSLENDFWLLRTLKAYDSGIFAINYRELEDLFQLVNLRYFNNLRSYSGSQFPFLLNLMWNLHTLTLDTYGDDTSPVEIWNMPHLRHVKFSREVCLPAPPTDSDVIMENLHTLKNVLNLKLSEDMVERIPNIKKLDITYYRMESDGDCYCFQNLECLLKLESFQCLCYSSEFNDYLHKLTFPRSIKKLSLHNGTEFELEEFLEKIGSLPFLQKLNLSGGFFTTREWITAEGQFRKLEILSLRGCSDLEQWTSESSHFPLLKDIYLEGLTELMEIPSEIGELPSLRAIVLKGCSESAVISAKKIVDEQEELQGEEELTFHVRVISPKEDREALHRLASINFQVSFD